MHMFGVIHLTALKFTDLPVSLLNGNHMILDIDDSIPPAIDNPMVSSPVSITDEPTNNSITPFIPITTERKQIKSFRNKYKGDVTKLRDYELFNLKDAHVLKLIDSGKADQIQHHLSSLKAIICSVFDQSEFGANILHARNKPMNIEQRVANAQDIQCDKLPKPQPNKAQIKARTGKNVKRIRKKTKKARPHLPKEAEDIQRKNNLQKADDMEADLKEAQNDEDYKPNVKMTSQPLRRSTRTKTRKSSNLCTPQVEQPPKKRRKLNK
eukprot:495423_1